MKASTKTKQPKPMMITLARLKRDVACFGQRERVKKLFKLRSPNHGVEATAKNLYRASKAGISTSFLASTYLPFSIREVIDIACRAHSEAMDARREALDAKYEEDTAKIRSKWDRMAARCTHYGTAYWKHCNAYEAAIAPFQKQLEKEKDKIANAKKKFYATQLAQNLAGRKQVPHPDSDS